MKEAKIFQRFNYQKGITLKDMQDRCNSTGKGLYVYHLTDNIDITDTLFMEQIGVKDETGEVLILEGNIWGVSVDSYKIFPTKIVKRISVVCVGDHWVEDKDDDKIEKFLKEVESIVKNNKKQGGIL